MLATEKKTKTPAAALYALPHEIRSLLHTVDRQSREAWKKAPIDALPPHSGPLLVFDVFDAPVTWVDDWSGRTLHSGIEIDEIIADQFKYARTADGVKCAQLAKRIRRRWCGLVDHAMGYRLPGGIEIFEFDAAR